MTERNFAETIETLASYLGFIEEHCGEFDHVLFRGQTQDEGWPLLPKLARLRLRENITVLKAEAAMLASLKMRSPPFLDFTPKNDWDWLSIAQHHGMATRLLDWTTNPLAALWFSVKTPASNNKDGVVWMFTPQLEDQVSDLDTGSPFDSQRTRVFRPRHINRRIVAQHGWFTVHSYVGESSRFIPLEENSRYSRCLQKLRVPASSFPSLRSELDRCGINAATLYSDLVGLCQDAEWQHILLDDEDPE